MAEFAHQRLAKLSEIFCAEIFSNVIRPLSSICDEAF